MLTGPLTIAGVLKVVVDAEPTTLVAVTLATMYLFSKVAVSGIVNRSAVAPAIVVQFSAAALWHTCHE